MVPGAQPAAARWVESRESKWRMWRSGKAWRRRARSIMPGLRARRGDSQQTEPDGRKRIAHGARPWVASGQVGQPRNGAGELRLHGPSAPFRGWALARRSPSADALGYCLSPCGLSRRRRSSYQLQAEAQVHGAGGVGDGAAGDEVGAHAGVVADVFESDAAGEFDLGAAGDFADPVGGFVGGEVIQQQMGGAALQGLVEFLAGADFDLDGESAMAGALECVAHAAGRRDVVVLDQDGIVEAHAVVHHAPGRGGCLFESTQSGRGLAGIEDLAARTFDGGGVEARGGGHAAEALQEVEGNALAGEEGAGDRCTDGDIIAIGAAVAILLEDVELIDAAAKLVDLPEQAPARETERLAGQKTAGGAAGFRDAGGWGDVASNE